MIHFDINKLEIELKDLEEKTTESTFWEDSKKSSIVLEKIKKIKNKVLKYRNIEDDLNNIIGISELLKEEYDDDLAIEMVKNIKKLEKEVEKFEIETLLSGKYDKNNAIVTIHPGAGRNRSDGLG